MNTDEPRPVGQEQGEVGAVQPQALGKYPNQQLGVYPDQELKDHASEQKSA